MPKRPKIKPTRLKPSSRFIEPSELSNQPVSFNLKYLQEKEGKFNYCGCENTYFNTLLSRLRDISRMNRKEMTLSQKDSLRCHQIDFINDRVSEKSSGILQKEEAIEDAWQFQLTSNEHGRVHGFFIGNVFYVVWLDPKHELYAG